MFITCPNTRVRLSAHLTQSLLVACGMVSLCASLMAADDLADVLQPLIAAHDGRVSVAVKHLDTGESFSHQADRPMPTASLIKFPLMIATYEAVERGALDEEATVTLKEEDKVPGSGILTPHFSPGTELSLRDAIHLMMVYSDNTATNLVIDRVGLSATADLMEQMECPHTKLHSKVFRRDTSIFPQRSKEFGLGSTTAAEMIQLLSSLQKGELVSEPASRAMLEHLHACDSRTKIGKLLPDGTRLAHKTGSVSASRCDAGIIQSPAGPLAVCVLTTDNADRSWGSDHPADHLCSEVGLAVYRHFNPNAIDEAKTPPVLKQGAGGQLVQALQRTLNARLEPSPDLGVDGDFGPATERAVVRFQQARELTASGEVDQDTWQALGTLITHDAPLPDPAIVNAEVIDRLPPDPLSGPPHVTCKAWAIADGASGKMLWGTDEDSPLALASITKLMTAQVVLQYAKEFPEVWEETVTFSARAADTSGSSCDLRESESLSVAELMYGLLLPSGNDAAVALAEHFGPRAYDRLGGEEEFQEPYDAFIAAMNLTARQLKMADSHFVNPHGLTEPKHLSSARDLLILAHQAQQSPRLAKIVDTIQHGATVTGAGGYQRNVLWKNTNRLLKTEGYDGLKTGTTNAAGSCLLSSGRRGKDHLILVVLGSTSTDSRYADSRNLYRWAWLQRGHSSPDSRP